MAQVFISYAREDRQTAEQLATALTDREWQVWWDRDLIAGEQFDEEIEQQLELSSAVVVLWSKSSVGSVWVKGEATVAAERHVLVPVQVEPAKVPLRFRGLHTVELTNWTGAAEDSRLDEIQRALVALAGLPETVPPPFDPPPAPPASLPPELVPQVPRSRPSRVLVGAVAAVVVLGLIVVLWALADRDDTASPTGDTDASVANSTADGDADDNADSVMMSGDQLFAGHFIPSPNGEYRLFMQEDGNLTIHRANDSSDVRWATGTQVFPGLRLFMQPDGNLVIYAENGGVWSSDTFVVDSYLEFGDDGHIRIVRPDGGTEWSTRVVVPDVTGLSQIAARAALDALELRAVTSSEIDNAPEGSVIRTNPAAGRDLFRKSPVSVVVSAGPTPSPTSTTTHTSTSTTAATTTTTDPD